MKVKAESDKAVLQPKIKKTKVMMIKELYKFKVDK